MALAVFLLCIAYAFVDWLLLSSQAYAQTPPFILFAIGGIAGGMVCALCLARSAVPRVETVGMSVLVALAVAVALWPGVLRLNAYTAAAPAQVHRYILKANATLWPKNTTAPALHAPVDAAFWRAQKVGSEWRIELQRGGLGLWQYNKSRLLSEIHAYYRRLRSVS